MRTEAQKREGLLTREDPRAPQTLGTEVGGITTQRAGHRDGSDLPNTSSGVRRPGSKPPKLQGKMVSN